MSFVRSSADGCPASLRSPCPTYFTSPVTASCDPNTPPKRTDICVAVGVAIAFLVWATVTPEGAESLLFQTQPLPTNAVSATPATTQAASAFPVHRRSSVVVAAAAKGSDVNAVPAGTNRVAAPITMDQAMGADDASSPSTIKTHLTSTLLATAFALSAMALAVRRMFKQEDAVQWRMAATVESDTPLPNDSPSPENMMILSDAPRPIPTPTPVNVDELYSPEDDDGDIGQAPTNYYELLEADQNATTKQLKSQYRKIQKICHPDIIGGEAVEVCILLNDAIETVTDPKKKAIYDAQLEEQKYQERILGLEEGLAGYTGQPLSNYVGRDPVLGMADNSRAVFVDESSCIGCRQCNHMACNTFQMEEVWGRARAINQWADSEEDIEAAIESCPVDCIHWVTKKDLPDLEFVMQNAKRAGIAAMMAGGTSGEDPFMLADQFTRRSQEIREKFGLEGSDNIVDWTRGKTISNAWSKIDRRVRAKWKSLRLGASDDGTPKRTGQDWRRG